MQDVLKTYSYSDSRGIPQRQQNELNISINYSSVKFGVLTKRAKSVEYKQFVYKYIINFQVLKLHKPIYNILILTKTFEAKVHD